MKNPNQDKYIPALSYDFLTPLYDPIVALTTREKTFRRELTRQVDLGPSQCILDVGCGTATLTIALKTLCPSAEVFGLDGDRKILVRARRKAEKAGVEIAFDEGLSYELPYDDEFFDKVVSSLFFHHLTPENKLRTLTEIYRVLKPGGFLHIADWGVPSNLLMRIASLPVQWLDGATTLDSYQGKLPAAIKEAGFVEVAENASFDTVFGTTRLLKAEKR